MLALAIKPGTGVLYGVQHDRDLLGKNWPRVFTMAQDAQHPCRGVRPDQAGGRLRWPYCHYDRLQGKKVLSPEYGGDGQRRRSLRDEEAAPVDIPGPLGPDVHGFYTKQQFPARYVGGTFVAFHGDILHRTTGRGADDPGYHVAFVPFVNGAPAGSYEIFASGFVGSARRRPAVPTTGPRDSHKGRTVRCTSPTTREGGSGG